MLSETQRKGSCRPCRENKAQCDRKKPRCSECISKNRTCGGYDMGHIFINVNSDVPPPVWRGSQHTQKLVRTSGLVLDMASQPVASGPQYSNMAAASIPTSSFPRTSPPMGTHSPPSHAMHAASDPDPNNLPGIVELFLDLYYKRNRSANASNDSLTAGNEFSGWRILLPSWIGQSSILDTAIGALAASFVGTQYQDENLIDQGRNMYLNAIQMVQQALQNPNSMARKDLSATTLVMSSIEFFLSFGGGPSQRAHIDGATRLLHSIYSTVDFEELHVYMLIQGLFESISTRRRFTFSSPSYRPLVRRLFSVPRTSSNDLFFQWCEAILPLPNILSAADSAVSSSLASSNPAMSTSASTAMAILDDLTALEQSMASWYESLKANTVRPWTFSTAQIGVDSVPFPLQFVSIEACTLYCLHWVSQLLILEARQALYVHFPLPEMPTRPSPSAMTPQLTEYASLVCRSVQFCTSGTSFASAENMFLPLFMVASYYMRQGDEERMRWCVGAFTRISQEHRIGYAIEQLELE